MAATNSLTNMSLTNSVSKVLSVELLIKVLQSLFILICALALFFVLKRVFRIMAERINLPRLAFTPLQALLRYGVLIIAAFMILELFDFKLQTLMTVLATVLGLVAIGFVAVWSVLSNFLCTFVLILFKPFSVGDTLEFPGEQVGGKVVDLTLLFTTLRGPRGEDYHIPNNMFFQKTFKRQRGTVAIALESQLRQAKPAQLPANDKAE